MQIIIKEADEEMCDDCAFAEDEADDFNEEE